MSTSELERMPDPWSEIPDGPGEKAEHDLFITVNTAKLDTMEASP